MRIDGVDHKTPCARHHDGQTPQRGLGLEKVRDSYGCPKGKRPHRGGSSVEWVKGEAWAAELRLEEVGNDVPTTAANKASGMAGKSEKINGFAVSVDDDDRKQQTLAPWEFKEGRKNCPSS